LLLAALLFGGAIFFVNGMRLKNRDIFGWALAASTRAQNE